MAHKNRTDYFVEKPTLVIVAPYPPVKSGIADYVERQAQQLKNFYKLILVDDSDRDSTIAHPFPGERISSRGFLETPSLHQRVLYHLGNSPTHLEAFKLLEQVPGVVTLHDFFLSDVQQYQDLILLLKDQASYSELIYAHGYAPLVRASEAMESINLSDYPCNLRVIESATRVLVHSDYVLRQALDWYGQPILGYLKRIGFSCPPAGSTDQLSARTAVGLPPDAFLVGTFGFATPAKCLETIINAWANSRFAYSANAFLVVAGEFLDQRYRQRIERLLELRQLNNVRLQGFLSPEDYRRHLSAVNIAVQLRTRSRGETSAALLDCLAQGVTVIANDHGFVEDIPDDVVWKVRAQPDLSELTAVLEHLYDNAETCQVLARKGKEYLTDQFDPQKIVRQLVEDLEALAQYSSSAKNINQETGSSQSHPSPHLYQQLLIDVTAVARFDLRTGIQRVVRALLRELILNEPTSYRVLPIYLDQQGTYRYAHQFMLGSLKLEQKSVQDEIVHVRRGDVYLGVDLHTTTMVGHASIYKDWHDQGVRIVNVLYDLLPIHCPQWFPAMVEPDFKAWLQHIVRHSDQVVAISRTVAEDLVHFVEEWDVNKHRELDLEIGWFHLGSDLDASVPSSGLPENAEITLERLVREPSFLMVGTIEPRKGHAQTLDAFEKLWASGYNHNLVIVGKQGWQMDSFIQRLQQHPERDRKLFWLEAISDEYLERIYPCCEALIAASEGEGFGLPLIEAARHHIPVIARDIPVFREIAGPGAFYFSAQTPDELAAAIQRWMTLPAMSRPDISEIKSLTWKESVRQLLNTLKL